MDPVGGTCSHPKGHFVGQVDYISFSSLREFASHSPLIAVVIAGESLAFWRQPQSGEPTSGLTLVATTDTRFQVIQPIKGLDSRPWVLATDGSGADPKHISCPGLVPDLKQTFPVLAQEYVIFSTGSEGELAVVQGPGLYPVRNGRVYSSFPAFYPVDGIPLDTFIQSLQAAIQPR